MTSIEEKLIGKISAQLTRAVEEANLAYEFAPGSYTAGALNALLSAQDLVRELANASGCHRQPAVIIATVIGVLDLDAVRHPSPRDCGGYSGDSGAWLCGNHRTWPRR